jgi:hypothetical protein
MYHANILTTTTTRILCEELNKLLCTSCRLLHAKVTLRERMTTILLVDHWWIHFSVSVGICYACTSCKLLHVKAVYRYITDTPTPDTCWCYLFFVLTGLTGPQNMKQQQPTLLLL